MSRKVKVVIVGAGSWEFSKHMIYDMILEKDLLNNCELDVVLVDLHSGSLEKMLAYAQACNKLMGTPIRFSATTDRCEALVDADFVLISVAIGRLDLWEQDFRIPLAYGIKHVYGENGGPGALFHALRNYQLIMPICADIERICPKALVMNFTNPEARILTAILKLTKLNAIGLCHGFYEFYEFAAKLMGRPHEEMDIRTAGMNHCFAYYKIADRKTGADLIPEFERRLDASKHELEPFIAWFWEKFHIFGYPSDRHFGEYCRYASEFTGLRWLFGIEDRPVIQTDEIVTLRVVYNAWSEHKDVQTYLKEQAAVRNKEAAEPKKSEICRSNELAVPIIADVILNRKELRSAVNVLNTEGYIENLAPDACIEVPAIVDADGVHPEKIGSLPEVFAAMIRLQNSIQSLLVEAYQKRSKKILLQALLLDPTVDNAVQAEKMLDYMLDIQKQYLPQLK